jgi:hypothetical protein
VRAELELLLANMQWCFVGVFSCDFHVSETAPFITGFHIFNEGCLKENKCLSPETVPSHELILKLQRQKLPLYIHILGVGITSKKMLN